MPISSASTRTFHAEDPVMETDLDLLAKVDQYKEDQFQEGAKELQSEINNWSLLANVAKPQDRQYINGKLVGLVNKVNSLGGVDLSDPNNVNQLKNLGYSLYADQKVMNPVMTTRKMNALQQDIYNKTNGKNAKDYDSVYGEYLVNQYSDWLNDGKQGTSFEGATALPQGNFSQYQEKLNKGLKALTPDLNEAPQSATDALNYYQVGDKFIKKERVQSYIDANTSEQDRAILNAHAWKAFQGYSDTALLQLKSNDYDSKMKSLQDTWNDLQRNKSLVRNNPQQLDLYTGQMDQISNAIDTIRGQKSSLPSVGEGESLPKEFRENLQSNIFNDAFKEDMSNAWSFEQKKIELKTNQAAVKNVEMAQRAYQFGKMYDLHLADFNLKEKEFGLKEKEEKVKEQELQFKYGVLGLTLNGPAQNAPLSLVTTKGKDGATMVTNDVVEKADANYIKTATDFSTYAYNYLMTKDPNLYGKYLLKDADGNWEPTNDQARGILGKAIKSAGDMYGNVANMSLRERVGLNITDDDQKFFEGRQGLKQAELYKNEMKDVAEQVFRQAGKESPYTKPISIRLKNGSLITKTPEGDPLTYASLKEMIDRKDPVLDVWGKQSSGNAVTEFNNDIGALAKKYNASALSALNSNSDFYKSHKGEIDQIYKNYGFDPNNLPKESVLDIFKGHSSLDFAKRTVDEYYNSSDVSKAWDNASKTFNVFGATPPDYLRDRKTGALHSTELRDFLADQVGSQHPELKSEVKSDDIDIIKVYPVFNSKVDSDNPVRYLADVRYRKGAGQKKGSGDKIVESIDLTNEVNREHESGGGILGNLYANDNAEVVYGMLLNNKGMTPLDSKDQYSSALQTSGPAFLSHKYQLVTVKNPSTKGVDGYRINILVPKGKDQNGAPQYQVIPVKNFDNTAANRSTATYNFPANYKYARQYMDYWFSNLDNVKEFYRLHDLNFQ